jgi:hypothetical protein
MAHRPADLFHHISRRSWLWQVSRAMQDLHVEQSRVAEDTTQARTHRMCSSSSLSNAVSPQCLPHIRRCAYSMQCAAERGVSASVHSGNVTCGGKSQSVQSKHGDWPGKMTLACPLKPSVPPSIKGFIVSCLTLPSGLNSAAHRIQFSGRSSLQRSETPWCRGACTCATFLPLTFALPCERAVV